MYRATTPTITFRFPENIDMTQASDVKVTFKSKRYGYELTKEADDLIVEEHSVSVLLSQEETLEFGLGSSEAQINWLYNEGTVTKRACSNIVALTINDNLLNEVWE